MRPSALVSVALLASAALSASCDAAPLARAQAHVRERAQSSNKQARKDASISPFGPQTVLYRVTFKHAHTHERMPFARVADANEVRHFLRCRATWSETEIAPELVPLAASIAEELGADSIDVVSGYRSPKLNEMLRKKEHEVASESQHTQGHALDFKVPGATAVQLARMASARHRGGIGTYRQSNFIHIDIGRNRRWGGR